MPNLDPLIPINLGTNADDGTGDELRVGGEKVNTAIEEIQDLLSLLGLTETSADWDTFTGNVIPDNSSNLRTILQVLADSQAPDELISWEPGESVIATETERIATDPSDNLPKIWLAQATRTTGAVFDATEADPANWVIIGDVPVRRTVQHLIRATTPINTTFDLVAQNIAPDVPVLFTNAVPGSPGITVQLAPSSVLRIIKGNNTTLVPNGTTLFVAEGETWSIRYQESTDSYAAVRLSDTPFLRNRGVLLATVSLENQSSYVLDASGGAFSLDLTTVTPSPVAGDTLTFTKTDSSANSVEISGAVNGVRSIEVQGSRWSAVYNGSGWVIAPENTLIVDSLSVGSFEWNVDGLEDLSKGYMEVKPRTVTSGALTYPVWAGRHPEFVVGDDIVFPADVAGMFIRNLEGDAAAEGVFQADRTAVNGLGVANHANLTNRSGVTGGPTPGWFSDVSGTSRPHTMTGDTETNPVNRAYRLYTKVDGYGVSYAAGTLLPAGDAETLLFEGTVGNGGTITLPSDLSEYERVRFQLAINSNGGAPNYPFTWVIDVDRLSSARLWSSDAGSTFSAQGNAAGRSFALLSNGSFTLASVQRVYGLRKQQRVVRAEDLPTAPASMWSDEDTAVWSTANNRLEPEDKSDVLLVSQITGQGASFTLPADLSAYKRVRFQLAAGSAQGTFRFTHIVDVDDLVGTILWSSDGGSSLVANGVSDGRTFAMSYTGTFTNAAIQKVYGIK